MKWTSIRVSVELKAELQKLRIEWVERGHILNHPLGSQQTRDGQESKRDEIGLNQVIRRLMELHRDHQRRGRSSKRRNVTDAAASDEGSTKVD